MKTRVFVFMLFMFSFLLYSNVGLCGKENEEQKEEQSASDQVQTLQIVSSPELYDLAIVCLAGFGNSHPEQNVTLISQTDINHLKDGNLYLFTGDNTNLPVDNSLWKMVIGHDLVVPVFNSKNPFFDEINKKGITVEDFAMLLCENSNWSMVIDGASKTPVQCFITDNQNVITKIAGFTKTEQETILATKVKTATELISMVQQNENAIGFCKLTDVLNSEKIGFADQISILPVDKNKNGRIDSFENIYSSPETLTRGAWIGKYPLELCGEIYALSTAKPTNQTVLDFIAYLSVEGQDNIKKSGYSILSSAEKTANLHALTNSVSSSQPGNKSPISTFGWILIFSLPVLVMFLIVLFRIKRSNQSVIDSDDIEITPALNENSILAPKGLYYDKTHTWAFMEQDGLVKIGVDDFLKNVTGQITQLKMKSPGEKIRKGEVIFTIIRNGKQLNLYSPVSGYIRKQNSFLIDTPSKINILPFSDGWVYQIEPTNWIREVRFLFMSDNYREWLEDEFTRLKDFLAVSANTNPLVYEHIVLQDGGELKENVLANLGPEVWEDFQIHFIDTSK